MDVAQEKFWVVVGWSRAWLLMLPAVLIWVAMWPHHLMALFVTALLVVPLGLLVVVPNIEVGRDGMRLNRVNRVRWADIVEVRVKRIFGLPYLNVRRNSGLLGWWLPLYLRHPERFVAAIHEFAPRDNPIRRTVDAYFTQQSAAADAATASRLRRG